MKFAEISSHHGASSEAVYGNPICRSWVCDFCHAVSFPSYTEAAQHEMICQQKSGVILDHQHFNSAPKDSFSLSISDDENNLSDRQCFIRSHFIEAFIVNVSQLRCIKGASKLNMGQVGLRCKFCYPLPSHERADRSACFPSSISRLYQAVADMQRFHFVKCQAIPPEIMAVYNEKKTTRQRGQGSPQSYWVVAAALLNLTDSAIGIILKNNNQNAFTSMTQVRHMCTEEREGGRESHGRDELSFHRVIHERTSNHDVNPDATPYQASSCDYSREDPHIIVSQTSRPKTSDESDVSLILLSLKASR